jgi:hypothetical protein
MPHKEQKTDDLSLNPSASPTIKLKCCICGRIVENQDPEAYSLQVRKVGAKSPEMLWAHGPCLIRAIPVIGVEIPT